VTGADHVVQAIRPPTALIVTLVTGADHVVQRSGHLPAEPFACSVRTTADSVAGAEGTVP
jgi:hypothetical protein